VSLLEHIAEVADEPHVLDPAAPERQSRENAWFLSCPDGERANLSVAEVVDAFESCAAAVRRRLRGVGHATAALFYVWHDAMAGQLRCSTTSLPADRLRFGATVVQSPLERIVEEFLRGSSVITWSSLDEAEVVDDDLREWTVEVWHTVVA
jgi:hypothetical protein